MAKVVEVNDVEELSQYRLLWNSLFQNTPNASFFLTFDWLVPAMESQTVVRISRSRSVPLPSSILSSRRSSQPVPSRQGEHLPQDSCL